LTATYWLPIGHRGRWLCRIVNDRKEVSVR
jgi:hypothetical protein